MPASTTRFLRPCLALAVAMACLVTTPHLQAADAADSSPKATGTMMEPCQAMMAHKEKMMAEMKAEDTALAEQVAQMNRAADGQKLGLLAALVTRMADQRIARDAHLATMGDSMMKHMMQHMQQGQESLSGCPAMKDMNELKGTKGANGTNDVKGSNESKGMNDQ